MGRKILTTVCCVVAILLVFLVVMPAVALGATESDRYTATTADGVQLVLKRYRPAPDAAFREGAQPVLCMPGLSANFNEFDIHTPEWESYNLTLPDPLAPWAQGDPYIQADHLKYYSTAHYLWNQGYDVWLANYRGEGRGEYMSGGVGGYSIDDYGIYDVPAVVQKVFEETGKHPVWLGHSMGSSMIYIYLEGAKYGAGSPYVVSDPALVAERNAGDGPQSLKGLVDMDGPMVPVSGPIIDNFLIWIALYWPWYIDLRPFLFLMNDLVINLAVQPVLFMQDILWQMFKILGVPNLGPINALLSINARNMDPAVMSFALKNAFDGISLRATAQYMDAAAHGVFREDYGDRPGWFQNIIPQEPGPGDPHYCYSDNLAKISLPALVLADDRLDITIPDDIHNFFAGKGRNALDTFFRVPDAAHGDIVCGLNAPTITFPKIGEWLQALSGP